MSSDYVKISINELKPGMDDETSKLDNEKIFASPSILDMKCEVNLISK